MLYPLLIPTIIVRLDDQTVFKVCTSMVDFAECRVYSAKEGLVLNFVHPNGASGLINPDGSLLLNMDPYAEYLRQVQDIVNPYILPQFPNIDSVYIQHAYPEPTDYGYLFVWFNRTIVGVIRVLGNGIREITAIVDNQTHTEQFFSEETHLEAWLRVYNSTPRRVWTMSRNPFNIGGMALAPVHSHFVPTGFFEVNDIQFFTALIGSKAVVCEAYSGAIVGSTVEQVTQDIENSTPKVIYAQIRNALSTIAVSLYKNPAEFISFYEKS